MTLKPNSLKPMNIATVSPALSGKRGAEALVAVHAAVEELQFTADQLVGPLAQQQRDLTVGDETGLIELITELRDLFEHLGGHCDEASEALWEITNSLACRDDDDAESETGDSSSASP